MIQQDYDFMFSVITRNGEPTAQELRQAIARRLMNMDDQEVMEACGLVYEIETDDQEFESGVYLEPISIIQAVGKDLLDEQREFMDEVEFRMANDHDGDYLIPTEDYDKVAGIQNLLTEIADCLFFINRKK
jgi:hypothetical protein